MENGPFRMGGQSPSGRTAPTGRTASERSAAAERTLDKITLLDEPEEPRRTERREPAHHEPKKGKPAMSKKQILGIGAAVVVVLLILAFIGNWLMSRSNTETAIDGNKYQAVFFTNGQVYFGKLKPFNNGYMKLSDVYYLQAKTTGDKDADSENPQTTTTGSNDVQLIKLGNEVHGPDDEMIISKDQMLFFENLKKDGKVADSISKYKAQ